MADAQIADLFSPDLLTSGLMAAVSGHRVIIRNPVRQTNTVISLADVSSVRRIRTTYPALLVISAGFYLISAACFYSNQGESSVVIFGLLGAAFTLGFFLSRRASVAFAVGNEITETASGSLSEAARFVKAVQEARKTVAPEQF